MKQVGMFEAKTHLSRLVEEVEKGGEIVITRRGKPVARLVHADNHGHTAQAIARRRKAIAELRAMARKRAMRVSHDTIKSWIEEGRH